MKKHLAERLVFVLGTVMVLADGFIAGGNAPTAAEWFGFRYIIGAISLAFLVGSLSKLLPEKRHAPASQAVVIMAIVHIAYLNVVYNFRFDYALLYFLILVLGSGYFRTRQAFVVFISVAALCGAAAIVLAQQPEISKELLVNRLVLAVAGSIGLSMLLRAQQRTILRHNKRLLQANETLHNLSMVAEKIGIGAVITNNQGKVIWANKGFETLLHCAQKDLIDQPLMKWFPALEEAEQTTLPPALTKECVAYAQNGQKHWVSLTITAIANDSDLPDGHIGLVQDISEQKQAESEMRHSEMRFRRLFQQSSVAILVESLEDNTILDANGAACEMHGLTQDELVGRSIFDTIPPDYLETAKSNYRAFRKTNGSVLESYALHSSGKWVPVAINISAINYFNQPSNLLFMTDITEQVQTRQRLAENESKYRRLIENSRAIILTHDLDGRILSINKEGARSIGYNIADVTGKHISHFIDPKFATRFQTDYLDKITRTGKANGVMAVVHKKNAETRYWYYRNVLDGIGTGDPKVIGFGQDMTEQVLAEREVRKAKLVAEELLSQQKYQQETIERKNRELDQFAYVVSHDLKAPLRGINTLTTFLEEDLQEHLSGEARQYMDLIHKRVSRMEQLINGILEYSRTDHLQKKQQRIDLKELVASVIDLIAPPESFKIEVQAILPEVMGNPVALQQVFQNLIGNAIKYNDKEEGHVLIQCRPQKIHYEFIITDNGPGISPDFHDRIFGIFQTLETKDKVESTGIGLTIVKKIIENQGGTISLESEPGRGARFTFTWPIPKEAAAFEENPSAPSD